jgi:hypothetical protein
MPENNTTQTSTRSESKGSRLFRVRAVDGYQPLKALTSKPPRGRSGVPSSAPEKSAKKATGA